MDSAHSLEFLQADSWRQAFQLPEIILKRDIELGDLVLGFEQSRQMSLNTPDDRMLLAVVRTHLYCLCLCSMSSQL